MITGAHTVVFTTDAEGDRAFFRDVLELDSVDAGGGWLIFALPPAEVAVHPAGEAGQKLYLMCDEITETVENDSRERLPLSWLVHPTFSPAFVIDSR